ncbi:MAG: GNAT family N-acetyltransferase, partial [Planctomycetales bacterium]|nr:GNAT family N-acetyltransferase [Planctomycetales bacterium]
MFDVICLRDPSELATLRDAWQQLAKGRLFADFDWLGSWADSYVNSGELQVVVARDQAGQVAAILPLYRDSSLVRGRTLKFLGSGKVCTEYQTLLVRESEPAVVIRAVAAWLAQSATEAGSEWDVLELESTHANDVHIGMLVDELSQRNLTIQVQDAPCCWKVTLAATWDEQLAGLAKDPRRKIRKIVRDYVDTQRATLSVAEGAEQQQRSLDLLIDFHQQRWRDAGIEGCFTQPEFERFLRQAVERLGAAGRVWLGRVDVDQQPVAVSLFIRDKANEYVLYQCGMDPAARACQPGWLSNVLNLQRLIDQGATHCDYLRGEERYKRELAAEPVAMTTFAIAAPHVVGRFRHAVVQTEQWLKDWRRQFRAGN